LKSYCCACCARCACRHTSRFIICYLTFLPFALWDYLAWVMLPTMIVLTFLVSWQPFSLALHRDLPRQQHAAAQLTAMPPSLRSLRHCMHCSLQLGNTGLTRIPARSPPCLSPSCLPACLQLMGIENVGVQIEDPLRVLPLHKFCEGNKAAANQIAHRYQHVDSVVDGLLAATAAGAAGTQAQGPKEANGHPGAPGGLLPLAVPARPSMTRSCSHCTVCPQQQPDLKPPGTSSSVYQP
jgi:hypothetical protein